jgi:hypothetical protein
MHSKIVDLGKSAIWLILLNASDSLIYPALLFLCQRRNGVGCDLTTLFVALSIMSSSTFVRGTMVMGDFYLSYSIRSSHAITFFRQDRVGARLPLTLSVQKLIWNKMGSGWLTLYRTWTGVMHQLCLAWSKKQSHRKSYFLICPTLLILCQRHIGDAWSYKPFLRSFYHEFLNVCQRHIGDGWFLSLLLISFKPCDIFLQARPNRCSTSFDVIQELYDTIPIWNKARSIWLTLYRTWTKVMHQLCLAWSKKQSHRNSYVSIKRWGGLHSGCSHSTAHFLIRQHSTATSPHLPDNHRVESFIARLLAGVSLPCFVFPDLSNTFLPLSEAQRWCVILQTFSSLFLSWVPQHLSEAPWRWVISIFSTHFLQPFSLLFLPWWWLISTSPSQFVQAMLYPLSGKTELIVDILWWYVYKKLIETTSSYNEARSISITLYRSWTGVEHKPCLAWSMKQSHRKSCVGSIGEVCTLAVLIP